MNEPVVGREVLSDFERASRLEWLVTNGLGGYASGTVAMPTDSAGTPRRRNDQLAQMAGDYYSQELDLPVSLIARDGALYLRRPKTNDVRFGSFATDLFTSSDKMLLRIVRDSHGAVSGFTLTVSRVRDLAFVRRDAARGARAP